MIKIKHLILASLIFIVGLLSSFGGLRELVFIQYDLLSSERSGIISSYQILSKGNWILDKKNDVGLTFRQAGLVKHQDDLVTVFPLPTGRVVCGAVGRRIRVGGLSGIVCQLNNPDGPSFKMFQFEEYDLVIYFQKMNVVEEFLSSIDIKTVH